MNTDFFSGSFHQVTSIKVLRTPREITALVIMQRYCSSEKPKNFYNSYFIKSKKYKADNE
jgi:hypothetical protein